MTGGGIGASSRRMDTAICMKQVMDTYGREKGYGLSDRKMQICMTFQKRLLA